MTKTEASNTRRWLAKAGFVILIDRTKPYITMTDRSEDRVVAGVEFDTSSGICIVKEVWSEIGHEDVLRWYAKDTAERWEGGNFTFTFKPKNK